MDAIKTYQLVRTDILLGTDLNCYRSLITRQHKEKIARDRAVPKCCKCSKLINFSLDNFLHKKTDEYTCTLCFKIEDYTKNEKFYGMNIHFHDYIKKEREI